jgi:hypothetical protein
MGSSEVGDKVLDHMKDREFLHRLSSYRLITKCAFCTDSAITPE